jgi:sulfonate transport system permease protein
MTPAVRRALEPVLDFFRSLPKPALLPIAIVALGVGDSMKIFIIAFGALWPILLNTIDGVRGVDSMQLEMARVYGLTRRQRIFKVILPAASPQIFVGARVALAIAMILMVISEMVASTNGLGYFVLLSQQTFAIPEMWAGIILLGIIGYLTNFLFVLTERRLLAWHAGWRATALGGAVAVPGARRRRRATLATTSTGSARKAFP